MPGNIILTTCSLNHIAQAKSLGDSVIKYAPGYKLVIGLVDKLDGRLPAEYWSPHSLVEVHELAIPQFDEMYKRYTTLELNCALKSFFTGYVLEKLKPERFIFLDSDILLFDAPGFIDEELDHSSILLTPHITAALPADDCSPKEKDILKTGMFNAGFYALKNDDTANTFVRWWKDRMIDQCYERPKEGLNVDQKWLNFVPLYYKNVKVLQHPGCNAAYWNLHERHIEKKGDNFFVNNMPLIFFHFSGYSFHQPGKISRHQTRFDMNSNKALKELFAIYHQALTANKHKEMLAFSCFYKKEKGFLQKLGLKQ
ncbi:MAG TPA: hypothetical protein VIZ28_03870 [Chitinophagaceae bacterium]